MKGLISISLCTLIAVVYSQEFRPALESLLIGKQDPSNIFPNMQTILYNLCYIKDKANNIQSGLYSFSHGVVYVLPNDNVFNFSKPESFRVHRFMDRSYEVLCTQLTGRYMTLIIEHRFPDRTSGLTMIVPDPITKARIGERALIAGWNESQQPVVIKVKIDDLRITEIDVDLSSKESFYGEISYKIKTGDLLLVGRGSCIGFFKNQVGSTGTFSILVDNSY